MTPQDICDLYDAKPDMTLSQLAKITGLSIPQLKRILMG
jgi:hypothetical protein